MARSVARLSEAAPGVVPVELLPVELLPVEAGLEVHFGVLECCTLEEEDTSSASQELALDDAFARAPSSSNTHCTSVDSWKNLRLPIACHGVLEVRKSSCQCEALRLHTDPDPPTAQIPRRRGTECRLPQLPNFVSMDQYGSMPLMGLGGSWLGNACSLFDK